MKSLAIALVSITTVTVNVLATADDAVREEVSVTAE